MENNDRHDFLISTSEEIEKEYNRIQKRATQDPGTAGDQGEENWATVFKNWLPPNFQVVTKGRIINSTGEVSRQVDVIILRPEYPKKLLDKKLYLAGGVLAAFECKTTLKAKHIEDAIKNSAFIKQSLGKRTGSPYKELHSPIIFGLLAHSHVWKGQNSNPVENIKSSIKSSDLENVDHPSKMIDLICVADLATWKTIKFTFLGADIMKTLLGRPRNSIGINGCPNTAYALYSKEHHKAITIFTPVGIMITSLLNKIAWEYPSLRPLAEHFGVSVGGLGIIENRSWDISIYSPEIIPRIQLEKFSNKSNWDEWSNLFA